MADIHATFYQEDDYTLSLKPGTLLAGKYRLIKEIGRGGMGVVWSAEETKAARKVVLKFVPPDVQKFGDAVGQLKESFQKIHELHHQHICPVLTLDEEQGVGYFHVMKWLDGETLDQYVKRTVGRGQPLPFDEVLQVLRPVAEALDYAHAKRIIHRDIKPSNIFIELDETKTIQGVQIIDFGLASEIRSVLSRVSMGKVKFDTSGTRPYMAPEQWKARPQSAATDQYALAVTAYELLAGHLPFDIDDEGMLRMAVMQDPPEPIPKMPEHVNAALLTALAKDGGERFASCREFIDALGGADISATKKMPLRSSATKTLQSVAPGVESLMKRGHLFLEDSDWKQANDYFDKVLDIDPEYAPAYIGKLCAELNVQSEESLGDYKEPIADFGNFKKAVRFADDEYRTKIEGYDEKIRERLRQEQYDGLVQRKNQATEQQCLPLAEEFRGMNGYKDTASLAEECETQYHVLKEEREERERQTQYDRLVTEKNRTSEKDFPDLAKKLRAMDGYKDTAALADECEKQYHVLKEEREEQERQMQYDRLVAGKNRASEKDFPDLAKKLRAMDGYKDTAALAEECDEQYRVLKEQREEQERIEQERRQREKEERERREAEERERQRQERYERLVQLKDEASTEDEYQVLISPFREMMGYKDAAELAKECDQLALKFRYKRICEATKTASTEEDWQRLAEQFRKMNGYKNAAELAGQCDERYHKLKKYREEQERIERHCSSFMDFFDVVKSGTIEDVQYFVEKKGANVNARNDGKNAMRKTPLHYAARNRNVEIVEYLISRGARVNAKSEYCTTPLHEASSDNPNVKVVELLISKGADVNATGDLDAGNRTPLHDAASSNPNAAVLECLIAKGADVNAVGKGSIGGSYTVLDIAKTEEKKEILRRAGGKSMEELRYEWRKQGLCGWCGLQKVGFFSPKCKICNWTKK